MDAASWVLAGVNVAAAFFLLWVLSRYAAQERARPGTARRWFWAALWALAMNLLVVLARLWRP